MCKSTINFGKPNVCLVRCILCLAGALLFVSSSRGEEPVARFLERLRQQKLFDLAVVYLDRSAAAGLLNPTTLQNLELEKIILRQESVAASKSGKDREARAQQVEQDLQKFLSSNPNHARRTEAKLKLADIWLTRAQELLDKGDDQKQSAREYFQKSMDLFGASVTELRPILESMQGAKVDPNDREKLALRERYQEEYRQAEILQAYCAMRLGDTFASGSSDARAWLTKAKELFSGIIKKTTDRREAGRHVLCLLYRGQTLVKLGENDEALDSFIRVADITEGGAFRTWVVQATTEIVKLLSNPKQAKFEAAIERGDRLLKTAQANERFQPEWIDLQFVVAEAKLGWASKIAKEPNGDLRSKTIRSEVRSAIQALARRPGPQQDRARSFLADLGVEVKDASGDKPIEIKNFADGMRAIREKLDESRDFTLQVDVLQTRRAEADEEERANIDAELVRVRSDMDSIFDVALDLTQRTIAQYSAEDSREDLLQARYYLAFILVKLERYWDAAAVADFTCRSSLGQELGQKAGGLALFSYRKLLESVGPERKANFRSTIESLSSFLLEQWPAAEESRVAVTNLLQLAVESQQWEDVERYLDMIPKDAPDHGRIARELGYMRWSQYAVAVDAKKKSGEELGDADRAVLAQAQRLLELGLSELKTETLDERSIQAAVALARIYLNADRIADAQSILSRENIGPLSVARSRRELINDQRTLSEIFRLNMRISVLLASRNGTPLTVDAVQTLVHEMNSAAEPGQFVNDLVLLSQELIDQFKQGGNVSTQTSLLELFPELMDQATQASGSIELLDWIGKSALNVVELAKGNPTLAPKTDRLASVAESAIKKMLMVAESNPGVLTDQRKEQLSILQSQAARNRGNYADAVNLLTEVVRKNNSNLLAQLELARTYQLWGMSAKSQEYLKAALLGAEYNAATRTSVVWGWGRISQRLASQPKFQDYFLESRLNLAECRYQIAMLESEAAAKSKTMETAFEDVRKTVLSFPNLESKEWETKFDLLLRKIQRELRREEIGLREFVKT